MPEKIRYFVYCSDDCLEDFLDQCQAEQYIIERMLQGFDENCYRVIKGIEYSMKINVTLKEEK